jgi:hypothetical protein
MATGDFSRALHRVEQTLEYLNYLVSTLIAKTAPQRRTASTFSDTFLHNPGRWFTLTYVRCVPFTGRQANERNLL